MEQLRGKALFMIGIAAELAEVHPQTLRIYERKGLLKPKRTSRNTRLYSNEDIDRLRHINELTDAGINLAGIVRIMELEEELLRAGAAVARAHREMAESEARHRDEMDSLRRSLRRELAVIPKAEIRLLIEDRR